MSSGKWKRKKVKKVDDTQCKKCLYRASTHMKTIIGCNCQYILLMNQSRPCEPSPNCTVFKKYSKKERLKLEYDKRKIFSIKNATRKAVLLNDCTF
jgi:hypothetical protein